MFILLFVIATQNCISSVFGVHVVFLFLLCIAHIVKLQCELYACRYFNSLQSECFPVCFHSDANMVVSAPTGSGKTVLFELCILRLLSRFISEEKFIHVKGTLKTVSLLYTDSNRKDEDMFVTLLK